MQGILVVLLAVSFAMITQQFSEVFYRLGFLLLIASTFVQIVFGNLPPEAHYFGLQSYTFTHKGKYETDNETYAFLSSLGAQDVFFHDVPLNPKRIGFFNSLSDSINNVVIERQSESGSSWEQFRYFIITPV